MILNLREFPSCVPADFGDEIRKDIIESCLADLTVREDEGIDIENRKVISVLTSDRQDEHRTVLGLDAFRETIHRFYENPICLPEHQRKLQSGDAPCVGHASRIWEDNGLLLAETSFAKTRIGEERWLAYSDGHMRQFSIGFKDHKWKRRNGTKYLVSGTIREYSTVSVGSNDDATVVNNYVIGRLGLHAQRSDDVGLTNEITAAIAEMTERVAEIAKSQAELIDAIELLTAEQMDEDDAEITDDQGERIRQIVEDTKAA